MLNALVFAGCATLPYTSMSPEQINALAKIKDASVGCVKGTYAGATVTTTVLNVDKGLPVGVTVKDDCSIVFDSKSMSK